MRSIPHLEVGCVEFSSTMTFPQCHSSLAQLLMSSCLLVVHTHTRTHIRLGAAFFKGSEWLHFFFLSWCTRAAAGGTRNWEEEEDVVEEKEVEMMDIEQILKGGRVKRLLSHSTVMDLR